MKLYEISDEYKYVESLFEDEEIDEQTIRDTLEAISGEFEDKADNYAGMIKNLSAEAEMAKAEADRLDRRRKSLEAGADWLKKTLKANMEFIGKTKFKTALFSFSISKNGGKQPMTITENLGEIPNKFLIQRDPLVNKEAVRQLLAEKEVDWAHLEPYGTHLNIR